MDTRATTGTGVTGTIVGTGTTATGKPPVPRVSATGHTSEPTIRRSMSLRWCQVWTLIQDTVTNSLDHKIQRLGAALAFYSALSLAPLLVVVVGIVGLAFSKEATTGYLVWQIQDLVGRDGAAVVKTLLNGARQPASGIIATVLGLFTLFIGASSVVAELKEALNIIWNAPRAAKLRPLDSLLTLVKSRVVSFAMVLGIGFLLMVSLAMNAALSAIGAYYSRFLPTSVIALQTVDTLVSFLVIGVLFAAMFKALPDVYVAWTDVALGAAITSALFTIGKLLIGVYLGRASLTSTYGAAGSLVVLLLWIYYSAQIFYLGAEFTHAYAEQYGSQPSAQVGREVEVVSRIVT